MLRLVRNIVFIGLLVISGTSLSAQTETSVETFKHSFGIQFNHATNTLSEFIFGGVNERRVFALRYGYMPHSNILIGPEFSGFTITNNQTRITSLHFGAFGRYQLNVLKRIKPFAELSAFYVRESYYRFDTDSVEYARGFANCYVAPGVSFLFFKNRIGIDLMYKISPREIVYLRHRMISFRLTYNFNFKK
jgi:hypothetical protein